MIQITRWKPDTCDCELLYSWDDQVPQDQRVHVPLENTKTCDIHKGLPSQDIHAEIIKENSSKNKALGFITERHAIKAEDIEWSFDEKRDIVLKVQNLTRAEKDALKDEMSFDKEVTIE